jgi:hypothetical protein
MPKYRRRILNPDAPWNTPATFDAIYKVAKGKGIEIEY